MRRTTLRGILLALALATLGATGAAAQASAADSAWQAGDTQTAERLYSARLQADSTDLRALHRLALIRAWNERYDQSLALFYRLLALAPDNLEARVDRARVLAWSGDTRAAVADLDDLLARMPAFLPALEARAQFLSWAGEYDAALSTYDRILDIAPEHPSLQFDRARVLSWAARYDAAIAVLDSLLQVRPDDPEALLGKAQVLAWSGRTGQAAELYRRVLESDPGRVDALRGLARAVSWAGDLVEGERLWRAAVAAHPDDVPSLVGLGQVLRWQGRTSAAAEVLRHARRLAPADPDVAEQLRWLEPALAPRVAPGVTYETDSDGNRITTTSLSGAVQLSPRLELRGEGYVREAAQRLDGVPDAGSRAWGGAATLSTQLQPGWGASLTLGAATSDHDEAEPAAIVRASLNTPGRYPVGAGMAYSRSTLDATAALLRSRVVVEELSLNGRAGLGAWSLGAGGAVADFSGRRSGERNRRVGGHAVVTRRVARPLALGAGVRAFSFERDLNDGYFDPDLYALAELVTRWQREGRRWSLGAELAPGLQQVGQDGNPSASFRGTGRIAYQVAPGRQVGLSLAFANSGLEQLSPAAAADYRYFAVSLSGGWHF